MFLFIPLEKIHVEEFGTQYKKCSIFELLVFPLMFSVPLLIMQVSLLRKGEEEANLVVSIFCYL